MTDYALIPAYNEAQHLQSVIQEVKKHVPNIIVIDDGSQDETAKIAEQENAIVLKHLINLGKGAALRHGCDYACHLGAKKIVVLDADTQHNPNLIPQFLTELERAEIVFGYRQLSQTMPFILRFGNRFISSLTTGLYHIKLKDTQCGYRAFTVTAYKKIRWQASDYSMESEMIANVGRQKLKYAELPIETIYADKYKGTTVIDGVKIVARLLAWRLFK